nr:hypothetical protein [Acutalibacter muris]
MAKGEKKVSISAVDNIIGERFLNIVTEQWYDIEVKMRRSLPFTEVLAFVDDVVQSCFQRNGAYVPEVLDFAIKSNIISKYTNVSMPDNLEHRYAILYNSDLVDFVCQHINMQQLQEMVNSINRKLAYMCDTNTVSVQNRLNDLISAFETMQEKTEAMFGDVTPDDMTRLVGAIGDGALTEEKIVEAYMKHKNTPGDKADE